MIKQMTGKGPEGAMVLEARRKKRVQRTGCRRDKNATVLRAEGDKQSAILRAEGYAQRHYRAAFQAAKGIDTPKTMALQLPGRLKALGASPINQVHLPWSSQALVWADPRLP